MRSPTTRLLLCLFTIASLGCGPYTRMPRLSSPGNTASQQFDAVYHDPYPLTDVGPEIVGGRPRGYQVPVPEVSRGRLFRPEQTAVPQAPVVMPSF